LTDDVGEAGKPGAQFHGATGVFKNEHRNLFARLHSGVNRGVREQERKAILRTELENGTADVSSRRRRSSLRLWL
jgi:hypothetical protein